MGYLVSRERAPSSAGASPGSPGGAPPSGSAVVAAPPSEASATPRPAPPPPKAASPAELAVIAPLVVGSHLEGWTVTAIHGVQRGYLALVVAEDGHPGSELEVDVCKASLEGPTPPATAGPYAVFYRGNRYDPPVSRAVVQIADAIRKNDPPLLPGFSPYATD